MEGWTYKFTFTFANGETQEVTHTHPHPQMFDIWAEGDALAAERGTAVTAIRRDSITPAGTVYPESEQFNTFTKRPPGRLNLNNDRDPVCPNPQCGQPSNRFYATDPDLTCPHCQQSMYPKQA